MIIMIIIIINHQSSIIIIIIMIRSQTDLSKALEECTSNAACASFLADYDLDEVPQRSLPLN